MKTTLIKLFLSMFGAQAVLKQIPESAQLAELVATNNDRPELSLETIVAVRKVLTNGDGGRADWLDYIFDEMANNGCRLQFYTLMKYDLLEQFSLNKNTTGKSSSPSGRTRTIYDDLIAKTVPKENNFIKYSAALTPSLMSAFPHLTKDEAKALVSIEFYLARNLI